MGDSGGVGLKSEILYCRIAVHPDEIDRCAWTAVKHNLYHNTGVFLEWFKENTRIGILVLAHHKNRTGPVGCGVLLKEPEIWKTYGSNSNNVNIGIYVSPHYRAKGIALGIYQHLRQYSDIKPQTIESWQPFYDKLEQKYSEGTT